MNNKTVYVVTSTELGWDCVVGVFDASQLSNEYLEEQFPPDSYYVISSEIIQTNLEQY